MYYPQEPDEPGGCMQSVVITRAIFSVLAVPVGIIAGAMAALIITFYMFTVSAPLALIPLGLGVAGVYAFSRWEKARIDRQRPPPDDR